VSSIALPPTVNIAAAVQSNEAEKSQPKPLKATTKPMDGYVLLWGLYFFILTTKPKNLNLATLQNPTATKRKISTYPKIQIPLPRSATAQLTQKIKIPLLRSRKISTHSKNPNPATKKHKRSTYAKIQIQLLRSATAQTDEKTKFTRYEAAITQIFNSLYSFATCTKKASLLTCSLSHNAQHSRRRPVQRG